MCTPHSPDINECLTLGLCKDAECVNTRGSFLCTCRPGLMLDPSRSRCVCECGWGLGGVVWANPKLHFS